MNAIHYPVLDTCNYDYEYLKIPSEQYKVTHTQLIDRDMGEIMHTTILLDEIKEEKSERRLGDYLTGQIEYNNRFDYENDESSEKYYYLTGALKTEIST